jgi:hypothetical protein
MRHSLVAWMAVPVLWGRACWAQQSAAPAELNEFRPASSSQPGPRYPQVNSDGRVRIPVVAPQAQTVRSWMVDMET